MAAFLCAILNQILNHFLKRPGIDSLVQKAVKMVTSPSHWLKRHTFIVLCSAARFYCPLFIFKPRVYQLAHQTYVSGKHMSLPTLSLSIPLCLILTFTHTHLRAGACSRLLARAHTHTYNLVHGCIHWLALLSSGTQCVCGGRDDSHVAGPCPCDCSAVAGLGLHRAVAEAGTFLVPHKGESLTVGVLAAVTCTLQVRGAGLLEQRVHGEQDAVPVSHLVERVLLHAQGPSSQAAEDQQYPRLGTQLVLP